MVEAKDIYWLAGLLEGEGCFRLNNYSPVIGIGMTDEDIIKRAYELLNATTKIQTYQPRIANRKKVFSFCIHGNRAAGWMMTLYTLMGERRQAKIKEILKAWTEKDVYSGPATGRLKAYTHRNMGIPSTVNGRMNPVYQAAYNKLRSNGVEKNAS